MRGLRLFSSASSLLMRVAVISIATPAAAQNSSGAPGDLDLAPGAIMHLSSECSGLARFDAGPPARFVVPPKCAEAAREANRRTQSEYQAERDKLLQSTAVQDCLKAQGIPSLDEALKDDDKANLVTSCLARLRRTGGIAATSPSNEYLQPINTLMTGERLYEACQSWKDMDQGVCAGYVMGLADSLSSPDGLFGYTACLGKGFKVGALRDIVLHFLTSHEDRRQFAAATVLAAALAERFPCTK